jgi:hypothetical protein
MQMVDSFVGDVIDLVFITKQEASLLLVSTFRFSFSNCDVPDLQELYKKNKIASARYVL